MSAENKAVIERWFEEVWNQGRLQTIDELLSDDAIAHGLTDNEGNHLRGKQHFRAFVENFRAALPDIHITLNQIISEGDMVVVRCTVRATHLGEGLGVAPTGRAVEIQGVSMGRIQDGRLQEGWNYFDFSGLMQQVGA